jgi:hypothetical protein
LRFFCARGDVCFDDGDTEDVHVLSYVRFEVSLRDATEAYLVRRLRKKLQFANSYYEIFCTYCMKEIFIKAKFVIFFASSSRFATR